MAIFNRETFKEQPVDFRIGAIISDGMWYSLTKWRKESKATEEELNSWIDKNLENGKLVQSPTGAKSYRFPLESVYEWYSENNIDINSQLLSFNFPPRIYDDMTETEGFLSAPLREIGIVSFSASKEVADVVIEKLRGIAKVRESEPGRYRAHCLSSSYVRKIIDETLTEEGIVTQKKIYSRAESKRREIVDFSKTFSNQIIEFYAKFAKSLLKKEMETIKVFYPEEEDQNSLIVLWVIAAIEKFDESAAVPFSGYLNSVLKRWPYDIPADHLGKELSSFQRQRSKAIKSLKDQEGDKNFTSQEISDTMGIGLDKFNTLEESHQFWVREKKATTITWDENQEEKQSVESLSSGSIVTASVPTDIELAHKLSKSILKTAIETGKYEDCFKLIGQIDRSEINMKEIDSVSEDFISELSNNLDF